MGETKPWFVIAGGGTGGHLFPGLAIAEVLHQKDPQIEITVFGTSRPIDRKLTEPRKIELVVQEVRPFTRKPLELYGFLRAWYRTTRDVRRRFTERRPMAVLGLGGYAAGPAVEVAARMGIPTALFNPDAVPGLANRRLAPKVDRIFVQWYETIDHFNRMPKVQCTGCPIRSTFSKPDRGAALRALKLDPARKTLLITGASQGAWSINMTAMELMDYWKKLPDWQIIHLTGPNDLDLCRTRYKEAGVQALTVAFTEQMPECMAASDLIISRAGASTLAEITAVGRASVLMPYPFDRKQHQAANARVLADNHAAVLVADENDGRKNARRLQKELDTLMLSDHRRIRMAEIAGAMGRHDSAVVIANAIMELVKEREA